MREGKDGEVSRSGRGRAVAERVISRECARPGCGRSFQPARRGPQQAYCSATCRSQAYALRRARASIDAGQAEPPTVLRDTVQQVIAPNATAREWLYLLGLLAEQLEVTDSAIAREHWQHHKLLTALQRAARNLDAAHPGGLQRARR